MTTSVTVSIYEWRRIWANTQARQSQHSLDVWGILADQILDGRQNLKNNPLVPIGRYALKWPGALEFLVDRNNRGITLDKAGEIEAAIFIYELSIADEFSGTQPYDRLRILYTRRAWYEDALRVCNTYLKKPIKQRHPETTEHFKHHADRIEAKRNSNRSSSAGDKERIL